MSTKVSTEEQEQIIQTIEMFEVITQTNPDDCQSLEILKEAYWKLDRRKEALDVTRRLADAYMAQGQYSSAMMEYEGILQKQPDSPEVAALLADVEKKLNLGHNGDSAGKPGPGIELDLNAFNGIDQDEAMLITTGKTQDVQKALKRKDFDVALTDDGNEPFAKFLIQHRIVPKDVVTAAMERVAKANKSLGENEIATSLAGEIIQSNVIETAPLLCAILDRTKFAYIPLDCYDVDRQIVKMLPESLTLGRLIVPFDILSRTVMIAMANPFDALGKEAVQQLLDYNVQWHIASPTAIRQVLRDAYRMDPKGAA
jgi:tetratricopeptide (TPR) repeat protein